MTATRRRSSQFQSTLPRRERRADGYERLDVRGHISIHAPAKGATAAFSEFPRCSADFNPRSREGSDILTARKDEHCFHFNPRSREGSDETAPFHTAAQLVFQSTLPRRERPDNTSVPRIHPHHFNPRSREGSDSVLLHLRTSHSDFNPRSREGSDIRSGRGGQAVAHFNPRSREGSDAYSSAFWRVITNFNPRSREGSDNSSSHSCRQIKNFNPRSREGSDGDQAVFTPVSVISIHAPVKGATRHAGRRCCRTGYFNPRSREGSDGYMTGITQNVGISIHAPAKGATARTGKDFFRYGYFNPRSREGSDVCRFSSLSRQNDFNPRSREGSDRARTNETRTSGHFNPRSREGSDRLIFRLKEIIQEFQSTLPRRERLKTVYLDRWCNRISIHAPAKGATRAGVGWWFACVYFNPRSREGSDHISVLCSDSLFRFQSTLPRRERPVRPFTPLSAHTFQSTLPRRERHGSPGPHRDEKNISIHAPAKGATQSYLTWQPSAEHFNPRSREGSDRGAPLTRRTRWHFNPRSREGSDCCMSPTFQRSKISIHAPAKGATQMAVPFLYRQRHFNPRSREGSDATSACAVYGMRYFNPRSREGSDISELHFPRNLLRISIHAPAKGATLKLQRP